MGTSEETVMEKVEEICERVEKSFIRIYVEKERVSEVSAGSVIRTVGLHPSDMRSCQSNIASSGSPAHGSLASSTGPDNAQSVTQPANKGETSASEELLRRTMKIILQSD